MLMVCKVTSSILNRFAWHFETDQGARGLEVFFAVLIKFSAQRWKNIPLSSFFFFSLSFSLLSLSLSLFLSFSYVLSLSFFLFSSKMQPRLAHLFLNSFSATVRHLSRVAFFASPRAHFLLFHFFYDFSLSLKFQPRSYQLHVIVVDGN